MLTRYAVMLVKALEYQISFVAFRIKSRTRRFLFHVI